MSDFFKNPQVAAKYNSTFNRDKRITIQGLYCGLLSDITEEVAEKLIALEDNQISVKEVDVVPPRPTTQKTDSKPLPEATK